MSTPHESDVRSARVTFEEARAYAVAAERFMRIRNSSSPTTIAARPTPDSGAASPSDAPAHDPWLEQRHSVAEERVLAEIAHELGNFFHKLYYWAEFLQEKRADHSSEATAAQMLTRTVGGLEEFLKGTLDYFRPLKLSPVQMPLADIVAGMIVQLRAQLHGWPVRVSDAGGWEQRSVLIDPARFPAVFLAVGRRLTERAPAGSGVHVGLEARPDGIEAAFRVEGRFGTPGFQTAASCVEWALAERIVALHGGRLQQRDLPDGSPSLVLFVPFLR
jgi:signal transduction histidine kinase